jgi:hypothetical protein
MVKLYVHPLPFLEHGTVQYWLTNTTCSFFITAGCVVALTRGAIEMLKRASELDQFGATCVTKSGHSLVQKESL